MNTPNQLISNSSFAHANAVSGLTKVPLLNMCTYVPGTLNASAPVRCSIDVSPSYARAPFIFSSSLGSTVDHEFSASYLANPNLLAFSNRISAQI